MQNYISDKARNDFLKELKNKIVSNQEIVESMNSVNGNKITDALDKIELLIATNYSDYQLKIFNPFDTKIADLIDKY